MPEDQIYVHKQRSDAQFQLFHLKILHIAFIKCIINLNTGISL